MKAERRGMPLQSFEKSGGPFRLQTCTQITRNARPEFAKRRLQPSN